MTEGGHEVHVAFSLDSLACKAEEWTDVMVDSVRGDLKSLEGFSVQDVNGTSLFDEDPGHHEVRYDDGDNHEVVLVDRDVSLEVLVRKGDRRETSLKECGEKINVNVPDGV